MIIMPVPKDIRSFEPRAIGPFSKRQAISLVLTIIVAGLVFAILGRFLENTDILAVVVLILCAPILACGFINVYGMPIWVYLKDVYVERVLAPKNLIYSTQNTYSGYAQQNRITYEYFDDVDEMTDKQKKKYNKNRSAMAKKRLKKFYGAHPEMKPID